MAQIKAFQRKQGWRGKDADGMPGPVTVALLGLTWHGPRGAVVAKPVPVPAVAPAARYQSNRTRAEMLAMWKKRFHGPIRSGYCLWYAQELTGSGHRSPSARVYGRDYIPDSQRGRIYNPPAGSVIILDNTANDNLAGAVKWGHAVASIGGGQVLSTDYPLAGYLRLTTIKAIESGWNMRMIGWVARIKP